MRRRAMVDSFLKKIQLEFTLVGFGLFALGWYETYQSSASFSHVESIVEDIQCGVSSIQSDIGELKSIVLTSFDQLQAASDVFRQRMVELETFVAITDVHQGAKYRQIMSSYKTMVGRSDILYSRLDTILRKKFGFSY